jgi:hypothetical protein
MYITDLFSRKSRQGAGMLLVTNNVKRRHHFRREGLENTPLIEKQEKKQYHLNL